MAAVKGAEASIAAVEAAVDEDAAVGIIGHEQGAVIAAIVAAVLPAVFQNTRIEIARAAR